MLLAVAILAVRHHFVLFLMAECAVECAVNCLRGREQIELLAVACRTVLGVNVGSVAYFRGHMHFMAFVAISRGNILGMRLVALRARRLFAVNVVAGAASQRGMPALVLRKLLVLLRVAGKAGTRQLRRECDLQRRVRVLVAVEAPGGLEMRFSLVAAVALGDVVF